MCESVRVSLSPRVVGGERARKGSLIILLMFRKISTNGAHIGQFMIVAPQIIPALFPSPFCGDLLKSIHLIKNLHPQAVEPYWLYLQ